jgi:Tfp pilus assembly protein PilW
MRFLNEKGVSLIELLAAITLSTMIIGGITALLLQTNKGFQTITSRELVQEDGRVITEHIVNKIRSESYTISNPNTGELKLVSKSVPNTYITYTFTRPNFTIKTGNGTSSNIYNVSNQVDEATLTYDPAHNIIVHLKFIGSNKSYNTTIKEPAWGS